MTVKTLDALTLEELTETYLCNKYGKDPIKCLDCEKHEDCLAGKRAIEILNEMTDATKSKWENNGAMAQHIKARHRAAELVKLDDPIEYLMKSEGINKRTARERMRKYRMKYPDLFNSDGKPKLTTYQKNEEIRKADYEAACDSGSPIQYYMKKYNLNYDAAYQRLKYYATKHNLPMPNKTESRASIKNELIEDAEEVSLVDFLNQHNCEEEEDSNYEMNTIEEEGKMEKNTENDCVCTKEHCSNDRLRTKYEELLQERDELMAKIDRCNNAIRSFETVMDILDNE